MKDNSSDELSSIPPALIQWIESQHALPPSMMTARTFYEAAKSAQNIRWPRKLDRFSAMHTWMTISLIADDRTRKYLAELIHDETDGLHWTMWTGGATRAALDDLDSPNSSSPGRLFKQRRDAAVKGLRMARENLAALDAVFSMRDLLKNPELQKFRDTVEQFTHASFSRRRNVGNRARAQAVASGASAGEVMRASFSGFLAAGDKVPDLSYLLLAAEDAVANIQEPKVDRHNTRSLYLREMFSALQHTAIGSRRIAFLTYASSAVFGEHIEKREVRRLVTDLVAREKELSSLFGGN